MRITRDPSANPVDIDHEFMDSAENDIKLTYLELCLFEANKFGKWKEYVYTRGLVEPLRNVLRSEVAENRLEGHTYLSMNHRLDMLEERIKQLKRASNFVFSQGKKDGRTYESMGDKTSWNVVSSDQARILTSSGKMTRTTGEGTHKRWEVAE